MFNPKFFRGKIVYQVFHDIQVKLNTFLKILSLHPTFATHELLWEFLLVQDIRRDSIIERCRRKLENARESQLEQQPQQPIFTSSDVHVVEVFFDHAQHEIGLLSQASHNVHRAVIRLACKVNDYNTSFRILSEMVAELKLVRGGFSYGHVEQKLIVLAGLQPLEVYQWFAASLCSVCATVDDVMKTIKSPLAAIAQLRDREALLASSREALERLTSKSGPAWANVFFEEKKRKEAEELRDRIYIVQTEINRISADIRGQHVTLASEIGAVYGAHEQIMSQMIGAFVGKVVRSHRVSLERLERMKARLQCAKGRGGRLTEKH